ncbi:hypothetical protein P8625_02350 [Tenacibaculum tangerinum]|uniref:Adhesin n=1 Tax=Tenacibaculum tangerinum TaxID=3038772 RepID=A0ABY8L3S5_9FLAO|nr:hypothetical protein [Tenacibaculum tangerinum]WGH76030.1 hypothetical protein P8625_02350 [Tenacibaculum tangerinum]
MCSKVKKITLFIVLVFLTRTTSGQNPEYAYLVKTTIVDYLHANNGSVSISTNLGAVGDHSYFASPSTLGNVYFDFKYLPDNFNQSMIKVYNYAVKLANYPDCEYTREEIVLKEDFNVRGTLSFGGCSFQQTVYPIHLVGPSNSEPLCPLDVIELRGGYDWQYKIGNGLWEDLASATATLNVNIGELYANKSIDINTLDINDPRRSIHFQTGYVTSNEFVAPKTYTVIGCSPEFNGYHEQINTTCSYDKDGQISLKLNRDLDIEERLVVTLYNKDGVLIGQESMLGALTSLDASNYIYKWPNLLDVDEYYFLYQTQNKNLAIPTPQDPDDGSSWDKLVKTPNFTISKPTNVTFSAQKLNDRSCFNTNDGKIQLYNTNGGTGRGYEYELNGDGNWIPFDLVDATVKAVIIGGLSSGIIKIRVRDNNECLAK